MDLHKYWDSSKDEKCARNITDVPWLQESLELWMMSCLSILDIGCGIGSVATMMLAIRPDLNFTLLNISQAQLDMCPDEFPKICGDAEAIPLPDNSFDSAMALYVMWHLDRDLALSEMRRVVRPGGVIFIYDMRGGEMPELGYVAYDWDGEEPANVNTDHFRKFMPNFSDVFPHIKPVIVREINCK